MLNHTSNRRAETITQSKEFKILSGQQVNKTVDALSNAVTPFFKGAPVPTAKVIEIRALLSKFCIELTSRSLEVETCYIVGSTVNQIDGEDLVPNDIDLGIKLSPNAPLSKQVIEGAITATLNGYVEPSRLASHCFKCTPIKDTFILSIGDIDIKLSQQPFRSIFADNGKAVVLNKLLFPELPYRTIGQSEAAIEYLNGRRVVDRAVDEREISFLAPTNWSLFNGSFKRLARGMRFQKPEEAVGIYRDLIEHLTEYEEDVKAGKFGNRFGHLVYNKLYALDSRALLHGAIDMIGRLEQIRFEVGESSYKVIDNFIKTLIRQFRHQAIKESRFPQLRAFLSDSTIVHSLDNAIQLLDLLREQILINGVTAEKYADLNRYCIDINLEHEVLHLRLDHTGALSEKALNSDKTRTSTRALLRTIFSLQPPNAIAEEKEAKKINMSPAHQIPPSSHDEAPSYLHIPAMNNLRIPLPKESQHDISIDLDAIALSKSATSTLATSKLTTLSPTIFHAGVAITLTHLTLTLSKGGEKQLQGDAHFTLMDNKKRAYNCTAQCLISPNRGVELKTDQVSLEFPSATYHGAAIISLNNSNIRALLPSGRGKLSLSDTPGVKAIAGYFSPMGTVTDIESEDVTFKDDFDDATKITVQALNWQRLIYGTGELHFEGSYRVDISNKALANEVDLNNGNKTLSPAHFQGAFTLSRVREHIKMEINDNDSKNYSPKKNKGKGKKGKSKKYKTKQKQFIKGDMIYRVDSSCATLTLPQSPLQHASVDIVTLPAGELEQINFQFTNGSISFTPLKKGESYSVTIFGYTEDQIDPNTSNKVSILHGQYNLDRAMSSLELANKLITDAYFEMNAAKNNVYSSEKQCTSLSCSLHALQSFSCAPTNIDASADDNGRGMLIELPLESETANESDKWIFHPISRATVNSEKICSQELFITSKSDPNDSIHLEFAAPSEHADPMSSYHSRICFHPKLSLGALANNQNRSPRVYTQSSRHIIPIQSEYGSNENIKQSVTLIHNGQQSAVINHEQGTTLLQNVSSRSGHPINNIEERDFFMAPFLGEYNRNHFSHLRLRLSSTESDFGKHFSYPLNSTEPKRVGIDLIPFEGSHQTLLLGQLYFEQNSAGTTEKIVFKSFNINNRKKFAKDFYFHMNKEDFLTITMECSQGDRVINLKYNIGGIKSDYQINVERDLLDHRDTKPTLSKGSEKYSSPLSLTVIAKRFRKEIIRLTEGKNMKAVSLIYGGLITIDRTYRYYESSRQIVAKIGELYEETDFIRSNYTLPPFCFKPVK